MSGAALPQVLLIAVNKVVTLCHRWWWSEVCSLATLKGQQQKRKDEVPGAAIGHLPAQ